MSKSNSELTTQDSKLQRGFTLAEMLIVISIIGILATIGIFQLIGVQAKARDAQRKADLKTIQSALELYKLDHGGYPFTDEINISIGGWDYTFGSGNGWSWAGTPQGNTGIMRLVPQFIKQLPMDPRKPNYWPLQGPTYYGYAYRGCSTTTIPPEADGRLRAKQYILITRLENQNDPDLKIWSHPCWNATIAPPLYAVTEQ